MIRFKKVSFLLPVIFALFVGATSFMPVDVYSSWWWYVLWFLTAAVLTVTIIKTGMWRRPSLLVMHLSLIVMLVGGGATALTSVRGTLHLKPSEPADCFLTDNGERHRLPVTLTLVSFYPEYYAGMTFPKDFHSEVISSDGKKMSISMNRIGKLDGYRFYQASFDDDGGSVLTVSHDPIGIPVTYFGYLLFAVGGVMPVVRRFWCGGAGRQRSIAAILALVTSAVGFTATATPAVSRAMADSLSARQVMFNGRVVPFNTVATQITFKLTGRSDVSGLTPEQFVASLIEYRNEWSEVAFMKVKSRSLRRALNADGAYVSLRSLYDSDKGYIPGSLYEGGSGNLDDAILRLDEKVALLGALWDGTLFRPVGRDVRSRSDFQIKAEIAYNRTSPVLIGFIVSLFLSVISFAFLFLRRKTLLWKIICVSAAMECLVFVWHWYVLDAFPVSDISQIMQFLATVVTAVTVVIAYRGYSPLLSGMALMVAAFLFLVSWLGVKDPVLSPLMPVLASPWLAVHVSIVMAAYALLGFTLPVAVASFILPGERERLSVLSESLLLPGTYLLGIGIIVGALWANVSWGRYWAWDPKETWALVTLMLYSVPLHRTFRRQMSPKVYNLYLILAFSSIVMTYAGVNCLSSLHAYN